MTTDVIGGADTPEQLADELFRWASYPFAVETKWAICDVIGSPTGAPRFTPAPGSPEAVAAWIVKTHGVTFAEAVLVAIEERQDAVRAVGDRLRHTRLGFDDRFWNGDNEAEDWLIEPVLARGRGHLLYAPPKAGKSLLALNLAVCLAAGREVLGRPAGKPVPVVYVDVEMTAADVRARLRAMGFGPSDDLSALTYLSLPSLPPLDTPKGGDDLLSLALDFEGELVVLDTIGRLVQGDENANDTAQNFAVHTGTPLKAAGVTLWRIDHSGKDGDRGARGGSAKNDDPDIVHRLHATPDRLGLKTTHKRVPWAPDEVSLRIARQPLRYSLEARPSERTAAADVATLNRIGIPPSFGKQRARRMLDEAGIAMSNERLNEALRVRKLGRDGAEGD